jgi:sec-independent protein translocase protein TatC
MLMTPPDIFSQTFLALPVWGLFEIGLIFAKRVYPYEQDEDKNPVVE